MFILALVLPLLGGCVVEVDEDLLQAMVDAEVTRVLEEKGCVTEEALAAYATTDWVGAQGYVSDVSGFVTDEELAAVADECATDAELGAAIAGLAGTYATVEDLGVTDAAVAALETQVEGLDGTYATDEALDAGLLELDTRVVTIEANYVSTVEGDVVRVIATDTTWNVATAAELVAAVGDLTGVRIGNDAVLTIALAPGVYTLTEPLYIDHPDGARLRIEGDPAAPAELYFDSDTNGIIIYGGTSIDRISDLVLHGTGAGNANGLSVDESSALAVGPMEIEGFSRHGVFVTGGSYLYGESSLVVQDNGDDGVYVGDGSSAALFGLAVTRSGDSGVYVTRGSSLVAQYATSTDNVNYGFAVARASTADLDYSAASGNGNSGYYTESVGLGARGASASDNGGGGFQAEHGGALYAASSSALNNNGDGFQAAYASYLNASDTESVANYVAYESNQTSFLYALSSDASGSTVYDYYQHTNGFIRADTVLGDTARYGHLNDVTDFVYGL